LTRPRCLIISSCHISLPHNIPILTRLLQVLDPVFQLPLLLGQLCHLAQRVLTSMLLQNGEPVPQILVLLCQLEYLCITIIKAFGLALDRLS
jgi:hypothetical protein